MSRLASIAAGKRSYRPLADPITIRIIDYDWSASEVYTLSSRQGDPLAMRLLSGTVKPAKGGATTLVFSSDFAVPTLSKPESNACPGESL